MAELLSDSEAPGAWFDLGSWLPTVRRALEEHQSQVTVDGDHVIHSGGQREPILLRIGVRRV
jgi:N-acetyl-1-D-myo-inositol-2-amino-2-deoxy-alpha-D-glucopyranoside deacetylase